MRGKRRDITFEQKQNVIKTDFVPWCLLTTFIALKMTAGRIAISLKVPNS